MVLWREEGGEIRGRGCQCEAGIIQAGDGTLIKSNVNRDGLGKLSEAKSTEINK